ncbi:uncharacterized protein [Dermacentor albipictus]|uniref:uncharacterized protein n=1 Tax=Dermacentor albipictus TaxID=60249 RepID=UPI0031FD71F9
MPQEDPPGACGVTVSAPPAVPTWTVSTWQRDPTMFAGLRSEGVDDWLDNYDRVRRRLQCVVGAWNRHGNDIATHAIFTVLSAPRRRTSAAVFIGARPGSSGKHHPYRDQPCSLAGVVVPTDKVAHRSALLRDPEARFRDCGPRVGWTSSVLLHVRHPPPVTEEVALSTTRTVADRVGAIAFPHPWRPAGTGISFGALLILDLDLCSRLRPTRRKDIQRAASRLPFSQLLPEDSLELHSYCPERSPSTVWSSSQTRLVMVLLCNGSRTLAFDCGPQGYRERSCTSTLRSTLEKITSGTSITCCMSHCYHFYVFSPMTSCCQKPCLLALHYYCSCTPVFDCGPQGYPERSCTSTLWSMLQKVTAGTSITCCTSHCYHFDVLPPMASCCQTTVLALHYYWFCSPPFGCGTQG